MGITSQRACARTRMKSLNPLIANLDNVTGYSRQSEGIVTQTRAHSDVSIQNLSKYIMHFGCKNLND